MMTKAAGDHNTADVTPYRFDVSFDVIRHRFLTRVYRSAMVQLLCSLYGLSIIVISFVFSVAAALTATGDAAGHSLYLQALQVYLLVISLLFLTYLHTYILRHRRHDDASDDPPPQHDDKPLHHMSDEMITEAGTLTEGGVGSGGGGCGTLDVDSSADSKEKQRSVSPVIRTVSRSPEDDDGADGNKYTSAVSFDAQPVNFYLRLGAIAFGIGTMVQDGFQLSQLLQDGQLSFRCVSLIQVVVIALHVVFCFFQTFYIFKSHRIVVHRQKCLVRFGFVHLAATNIAIWLYTAVSEIQNDNVVNGNQPMTSTVTSITTGGEAVDGNWTSATKVPLRSGAACNPGATLSWQASPYLYPCTVQYCLIAASIVCQMYRHIGVSSPGAMTSPVSHSVSANERLSDVVTSHENPASSAVDCDKAHRGLFVGLLILVLTLVAVSCYFVVSHNAFNAAGPHSHQLYASFIIYCTQLTLLAISTSAVVIAAAKFRQLRFVPSTDVDSPGRSITLETSLLIVALAAVATLECFRAVSSVTAFTRAADDPDAVVVGVLAVATAGSAFVQAAVQTVFVVDALRRVVRTPGQQRRKPGRTLVTFLLLANLSLFVVAVFEVERPENESIHAAVYGPTAWYIVERAAFPLTVFYRFHSVVCLSNVWNSAYSLREK